MPAFPPVAETWDSGEEGGQNEEEGEGRACAEDKSNYAPIVRGV